jgi:hypothetical protein
VNPPGDERAEPARDVPKARACLCCGDVFQSAWSGERICRPCKRKSVWRRGTAPSHRLDRPKR